MAKKYYWLKLKNDFFSQPRIKKLRRIAGGDTYTIIYLKMQLLSLQNEGKLYFEGIEENFAEEIALTIDEEVDNVQVTINFLLSQGILEEQNPNEFLLPETQASIGSETASAERVRRYRQQKSEQKALQCNTDVTNCNTEIEKSKSRAREDIKKSESKEGDNVTYGTYGNVFLTEQQYQNLLDTFEDVPKLINKVSRYLANAPKQYRNCFALIDKITTEDKWPKKQKPKEVIEEPYEAVPMPEEIKTKMEGWMRDVEA